MDRSVNYEVPLYETLEEHAADSAPTAADPTSSTAIPIRIHGSVNERSEVQCNQCGKLVPRRARNGWAKSSIRLSDLEAGAGQCEICAMVLTGLQTYRDKLGAEKELPAFLRIECKPGMSFVVKASAEKAENGEESVRRSAQDTVLGTDGAEFFVTPETQCTLKHICIGRPVDRELSSDACMNLAARWLRECQDSHPHCKKNSLPSLPSRVIDVGSDVKDPYLRDGEITGEYVTLSHCWGQEQPLTTTKDSLEQRKQGIPMDSLPKTFRDAVVITRRLGFQYLWIDSLCIIQGSKEDWEVESPKMGQIYRDSAFTIAAMSAKDGREGCFIPKRKWRESVSFETSDMQGSPTTVFVRAAKDENHDIYQDFVFSYEPLATRAWVLQERLLSMRVLIYSSCELVFECQSHLFCECGTYPFKVSYAGSEQRSAGRLLPSSSSGNTLELVRSTATKASAVGLIWACSTIPWLSPLLKPFVIYCFTDWFRDRQALYRFWPRVIAQYTQRLLTYDVDALPALSGLASLVRVKLMDEYLAGLWRSDLIEGLLWSHAGLQVQLTAEDFELLLSLDRTEINPVILPYLSYRTKVLCPPTWSWASVRGAVSYDGKWLSEGRLHGLAKILDARCTPATRDPTGSVSSGFIILEGPLQPVRIGHYELSREYLHHRCRVGELSCPLTHSHTEACVTWDMERWAVLDVPPPADPAHLVGKEVWRLRLAWKPPPLALDWIDYSGRGLFGNEGDIVSRTHTVHYFLLLARAEKEGCFERLGLFVVPVPPETSYSEGPVTRVKIV